MINPVDRGLLVLASLAEGEKHGYALMQDIETFAGVRLGPGSLYGALERLEGEDLVRALRADGRRRPYRITTVGEEVLQEALEAQAKLASIGLKRLAEKGK